MTTETSTEYEKYYVPEKSKLAICATIGLILSIFGAASIMNDMTFGDPNETTSSWSIFWIGLFCFAATLFAWFRTTIRENIAGMNSAQLKKSYVLGMFWFIFSEVMFFFAFFGLLCSDGEQDFCDKFTSEIMITGYYIFAVLLIIGGTSYFRHSIPYE